MRKLGNGFILGGLALLLAALCLVAYNVWDENRAGEVRQQIIDEVKIIVPEPEEALQMTLDDGTVIERVPSYELDPYRTMPTVEIDDREYVGTITIPAIDLELPVLSEWSYPNLKIAPCRYKGSAYRGKLIIMAHNYRNHFGHLNQLMENDKVLFTDTEGNVFHYRVIETEILQKKDVLPMESGEWDLTLFTCTLGGKTRVTVRCEKIEQTTQTP